MHEAAAQPAWVLLAYLVAGICFILALRGLSSPASSRRGNRVGMVGMAIAVVTTLAIHEHRRRSVGDRASPSLIGGAIGLVTARRIQMTAMPQLVAAFHSLVGMAAVLVGAAAFLNPGGVRDRRCRRRDPARQPGRDGARRRDRRDHLLGLGDRLPQAERQHVGRADPAARAGTVINLGTLAAILGLIAYFTQDQSAVDLLDADRRSASPSASC